VIIRTVAGVGVAYVGMIFSLVYKSNTDKYKIEKLLRVIFRKLRLSIAVKK